MLGSYPIATRPLATLAALNVVAADATVTATATTSFASQTVTVVSSDSASTCALSTAWDSQTLTVVESDSSSTCTLSTSFDSQELTIVASDASATAALSVSWDGVGRLMSSADATSVLSLSTSFDSAYRTVVGSTWSVVINPAVGPVQAPVTPQIFGSGYQLNDLLRIVGGNNDATVTVISRSGTGASGLRLQAGGSGYVSGTYSTQAITGTGSGCVVTLLADTAYTKWKGNATRGVAWTSTPSLTPTWRSLSFAMTTSSTTASVTADMVSGATAGVVATTTDAAIVDWQGIAIGPVAVDFSTVLECVVAWSGQRLISTVKETVRVGRTLTETLKVGRSAEGIVRAGE